MVAGFSDAAMTVGAAAMVNRSFLVRLHTGDPGNPVATSPLTLSGGSNNVANLVADGTNGYQPAHIAQGGVTAEASGSAAMQASEARYSNSADVDFGTASSGGGWGNISWISIWYNAADDDAAAPTNTAGRNAFSTHFANLELQTAQTVNANDPFVIRARTIDFISRNAA